MTCKFIVFLGLPGAGKGTQCLMLKKREDISFLSPGEIIRASLLNNNLGELSEEVAKTVAAGKLINNELLIQLVDKNLKKIIEQSNNPHLKIILDGVPRNIFQAEALDELLFKENYGTIDLVIYLDIKKRLAIKRLSARLVCQNCGYIDSYKKNKKKFETHENGGENCLQCGKILVRRKDDNNIAIRRRILNDKTSIDLLFNFYKNKKIKCVKIDAGSKIETVSWRIKNIVDLLN